MHLIRRFFLHSLIGLQSYLCDQISITRHELDSFLLIGNFLIIINFAFNLLTECERECLSLLPCGQGVVGCLKQQPLLSLILGEYRGWYLVYAPFFSLYSA